MEMNPIMERIIRLTEQWKSEVMNHPEKKVFCWLENSMTEYQMLRGFILFHMSEESTLDDVFIACQLPFDSQSAEHYGKKTLEMMDAYIRSWNRDEKLAALTGEISWSAVFNEKESDVSNFAINMNRLAKSFSCDGKGKKLVVCIFPQRLEDLAAFRTWVTDLLKSSVEPSVCYMLHDNYSSRLFGKTEKDHPLAFRYILPDMDLYGAMNQILDDKKNNSKDAESRDVISFQQLLMKLTEAGGSGDEKKAEEYGRQAISAIKNHDMPHMEALIHYLLFSLYSSSGKEEKASENIDRAIEKSEQAVKKDIPGSRMSYCQYLIARANDYFFRKKREKALPFYVKALEAAKKESAVEIQLSIYQMIGVCKRMIGDFDSRDVFVEGWKLTENMDKQQLQSQIPLRYYALELLKSGNNRENSDYEKIFASLWGENWKEETSQMEKGQKQRMSVLT